MGRFSMKGQKTVRAAAIYHLIDLLRLTFLVYTGAASESVAPQAQTLSLVISEIQNWGHLYLNDSK